MERLEQMNTRNQDLVGVVIIARNEGERLKRCLASVLDQADKIVYVDSGSSDGSVAYAQSLNIDTLLLDMSTPFSAARARNEGYRRLMKQHPDIHYVQFIDGDCELIPGWLDAAEKHLSTHPSCAIVAGRRKERFPEATLYNFFCDLEWNTPVGEARSCGGDFMVRQSAFNDVNGFNPVVIAGEEPELCFRLRKKGWIIYRLDQLMTVHDAAITHFSQWWKRSMRGGHAYAQGFSLHGQDKERYCLRESSRIWFWAVILPILISLLALSLHPALISLALIYPIQILRMALASDSRILDRRRSLIYAFFIMLGKWPEMVGQLLFIKRKLLMSRLSIIEYG
ncbi:glycosyltransferase family 2 protein [Desulfogranum mediterraneum]|uniref:glycosyltransferase family 2 protein n=1 Tax=Desulfogranum mediterraneum TaxID=160661 RepID=UPI001ABF6960|nr:glycosyltransferase [Desulfogranum mediterraneum]